MQQATYFDRSSNMPNEPGKPSTSNISKFPVFNLVDMLMVMVIGYWLFTMVFPFPIKVIPYNEFLDAVKTNRSGR